MQGPDQAAGTFLHAGIDVGVAGFCAATVGEGCKATSVLTGTQDLLPNVMAKLLSKIGDYVVDRETQMQADAKC